MKKLFIIILLFISSLAICPQLKAQDLPSEVFKSLNVAIVGSYSFLTKSNQDGNKSIAKGYNVGADASMMLFQVTQGWGMGPFASYTFTDAKNKSDISEKWFVRHFQAGMRVMFSSLFFDAGYSTSTIMFSKNDIKLMGATNGFVASAGYTVIGSSLIFRLLVKYSVETIQKNTQLIYSSSFNSLMLGAQLGYSF